MAAISNASAPLIALDAVVIDTETTGLDPRKARIVEIAARAARRRPARSRRRRSGALVRPGRADPRRPTRDSRHRRRDGRRRAALRRRLAGLRGVPRRRRGDRPFGRLRSRRAQARMRARRPAVDPPRTLDTRLLAEVAAPDSPAIRSKPRGLARRRRSPAAIPRWAMRSPRRACSSRWCRSCASRHPHAGRSRTGLPRADRRAGRAASRRLGRAVEAPARADAERTLRASTAIPTATALRDVMSAPRDFIAAGCPARRRARRD